MVSRGLDYGVYADDYVPVGPGEGACGLVDKVTEACMRQLGRVAYARRSSRGYQNIDAALANERGSLVVVLLCNFTRLRKAVEGQVFIFASSCFLSSSIS